MNGYGVEQEIVDTSFFEPIKELDVADDGVDGTVDDVIEQCFGECEKDLKMGEIINLQVRGFQII